MYFYWVFKILRYVWLIWEDFQKVKWTNLRLVKKHIVQCIVWKEYILENIMYIFDKCNLILPLNSDEDVRWWKLNTDYSWIKRNYANSRVNSMYNMSNLMFSTGIRIHQITKKIFLFYSTILEYYYQEL